MKLERELAHTRVCICVGAGGVGKTTSSAALAMMLARSGKRVALVTIDPAKRLADALGISLDPERPGEPQQVDLVCSGELWAMMLDPQATFDGMVTGLAPDREARDAILEHPIYQRLSSAVAGSQEFTAVAKLYELDRSRRFDAIVLDTPPSRNALDFLEAPDRLTAFLEGRGLTALLAPSGPLAKVAGRGSGLVFGTLGRLTGSDLLRDIETFFSAFGTVLDGFRERASAVSRLLADPATAFVIVTAAEREPASEAIHLAERLGRSEVDLTALIVNRVTPAAEQPRVLDPALIAEQLGGDSELAAKVVRTAGDARAVARAQAAEIERLQGAIGAASVIVPRLAGDLHDLDGIGRLAEWLASDPAERAAALAHRAV